MDLSKHWTLRRLAYLCNGEVIQGDEMFPITRVSIDSRSIGKGDLYWSIEGDRLDGNDFAAKAAEAGAGAVVVARIPGPKDFKPGFPVLKVRKGLAALGRFAEAHRLLFPALQVVGVTGSSGKTTTKEMIGKILSAEKPTMVSPGNFNNQVGCPLAMLEINENHSYAVIEMAARKPGDIEELSMLVHPYVSVLTNIGPAHLETFGSMQRVWETKSEILRGMGRDGFVIYWAEDPWLVKLRDLGLTQELVSFGFSEEAQFRAEILDMNPEGTTAMVNHEREKVGKLKLKLIGRGHVLNAMAAIAAAGSLGVKPKDALEALNDFAPVAMRGERVKLDSRIFDPQHVVIHDAYNANPSSMADSVTSFLRAYRGWPRIVVMGSMHELGRDSDRLHRETAALILNANGECVLDGDTSFIVVGTGPVESMAKTLSEAVTPEKPFHVLFETRTGALAKVKSLLSQGGKPYAVLFKASRAEAFEDLMAELKKAI